MSGPDDVSGEESDGSSVCFLQEVIPPEIIHRILLLLEPLDKFRLSLTCTRMYRAVNDPAVWSIVSFDYYQTASRKALDATLNMCSSSVKKLEIKCRNHISNFPWTRLTKHIAKCSTSLQHFSLLGIIPLQEQLDSVLSVCSVLTHVTLEMKLDKGIWFPRIPSLKCLEVKVDHNDLISLLQAWLQNDCFPKKLMARSYNFKLLAGTLHSLKYATCSLLTLPPQSSCLFQAMQCEGPMKLLYCYPFFEIIFKESQFIIPIARKVTGITNYPLVLVLSDPKRATSFPTGSKFFDICKDTEFSLVASTLAHLDLRACIDVTSDSLETISCHCPRLKFLSLKGCCNAFNSLSGLDSLSKRCLQLEGLDISGIHGVDGKGEFWDILTVFQKLYYLALEFCFLPLECGSSQTKLSRLLFLQLGYTVQSSIKNCIECRTVSDHTFLVLSQLIPLGLKVLWMSEQPGACSSVTGNGLKSLFCSIPNLQCVSLNRSGFLILPTESVCYQNIEKISLTCLGCNVTANFVESLIKSKRLTHCYLTVKSIELEAVFKLCQAPRLICLHIGCLEKPLGVWKSKVYKAAKFHNIAEFSMNIIPSTKTHVVHSDLMSLQYPDI